MLANNLKKFFLILWSNRTCPQVRSGHWSAFAFPGWTHQGPNASGHYQSHSDQTSGFRAIGCLPSSPQVPDATLEPVNNDSGGSPKSCHGTLTWLFAGQSTALPFSTMALRARNRMQSAVHFLKYKSSNLLQKLQAKGRKKISSQTKNLNHQRRWVPKELLKIF